MCYNTFIQSGEADDWSLEVQIQKCYQYSRNRPQQNSCWIRKTNGGCTVTYFTGLFLFPAPHTGHWICHRSFCTAAPLHYLSSATPVHKAIVVSNQAILRWWSLISVQKICHQKSVFWVSSIYQCRFGGGLWKVCSSCSQLGFTVVIIDSNRSKKLVSRHIYMSTKTPTA